MLEKDAGTIPTLGDEVPEEDERDYFLSAWQNTLSEVREDVEKEGSSELATTRKHGRHRLVSS